MINAVRCRACCSLTTSSLKVDPALQIIPQVSTFHPGQCGEFNTVTLSNHQGWNINAIN